jgi:hypothetical protein
MYSPYGDTLPQGVMPMSNEMHVMLFEIDGHAEVRKVARGIPSGKEPVKHPEKESYEIVGKLNELTELICEKIEREVKKLAPPYVTIQANVQFDVGSILMTGTVAVLSWAGSTILDAAKDEVQQQIGNLVKLGVQRAFSRVLSAQGVHGQVGTMEMSVTPQSIVSGYGSMKPQNTSTQLSPTPSHSSLERNSTNPRPKALNMAFVFIGIIFLLQLILLLDRFLIVQLKT